MVSEFVLIVLIATSSNVTPIALDHRFQSEADCQLFVEQAIPGALPMEVQAMPDTVTKTPVCVEVRTVMI